MLLTAIFTLISTVFSVDLAAQQQSQTLVLLGSEPRMCAESSCTRSEKVENITHKLYSPTINKIKLLAKNWPTSS